MFNILLCLDNVGCFWMQQDTRIVWHALGDFGSILANRARKLAGLAAAEAAEAGLPEPIRGRPRRVQ